jgi:hypothetical protein
MLSRIDQLCLLFANPATTRKEILDFVADDKNENININETNNKDKSRPVEFAAQSGNLDNLKMLIEEMEADVSINIANANFNLLQWAHDSEASEEVRMYLRDPHKRIWLHFNDGTTDLHINAMKGRWSQVEAMLAQDPDRICEMSAGRFSPLYWANLAAQTEMRDKLQKKLQEYKIIHSGNAERMLEYHAGMIFANIEIYESYGEFNEFLSIGKRLSANSPEWKKRFSEWLRRIGLLVNHVDRRANNQIGKQLKNAEDEIELLKQLDADQVFQKLAAVLTQGIKALSALEVPLVKDENQLEKIQLNLLQLYDQTIGLYNKLLANARSSEDKNWRSIEKYLNTCYQLSEDGINLSYTYSDADKTSNPTEIDERKPIVEKLKKFQIQVAREEKNCQKENEVIKIKREPLKLFFGLLQKEDKTVADIEEFLIETPVSLTEVYRQKTAVDHAVCFSTFPVAKHLVKKYPDALSIPKGSSRENLMQLMRTRNVGASTKAFILDPKEKIWERFNDGTTDLHVHAYAGRLDEVIKILQQSPERLLECNNHGEDAFYWSHHSNNSAELKTFLENILLSMDTEALAGEQWSLALKLYQAQSKYIKHCLSSDDRHLNASVHHNLVICLKPSEDTPEKIAYKDYVFQQLVLSYINRFNEDDDESQKELVLASGYLDQITDKDEASNLRIRIHKLRMFSSLRRGMQQVNEGNTANYKLSYNKAKQLYIVARKALESSMQLAMSLTEADQDDKDTVVNLATKYLTTIEKSLITTEELQTNHMNRPKLSLVPYSSDEKHEKPSSEKKHSPLSLSAKRHTPPLSVALGNAPVEPSDVLLLGHNVTIPQSNATQDRSIFTKSFSQSSGFFASPAKPLPPLHSINEVSSSNDADLYDGDEKDDEEEDKKVEAPASPKP